VSTLLGAGGGSHDIDVALRAKVIEALPHCRLQHVVDWPHLWRVGDLVAVTTSDGVSYSGMVLDVSPRTRAILIELDHLDP
jgi:hypothetical protein